MNYLQNIEMTFSVCDGKTGEPLRPDEIKEIAKKGHLYSDGRLEFSLKEDGTLLLTDQEGDSYVIPKEFKYVLFLDGLDSIGVDGNADAHY